MFDPRLAESLAFAREHGLSMTAGSDFHEPEYFCKAGIVTDDGITDSLELRDWMKENPQPQIFGENGMIETKKYNARGRYAFCVATQMLREIISRLDEIDATIDKSSKNWRVNRMALVDLCILRTATYELLYERISAPRILINESVEMAKSYGAERSHNFVNGLLQQICTDNQVSMD
jgi:transcription antitermination factor NusB